MSQKLDLKSKLQVFPFESNYLSQPSVPGLRLLPEGFLQDPLQRRYHSHLDVVHVFKAGLLARWLSRMTSKWHRARLGEYGSCSSALMFLSARNCQRLRALWAGLLWPLWLNKANALWSLCRRAGWASGPHWRRKRDVLVKKKNVFFVTPVQLFWHTSWTVFNTLTDCKSRSISCQSNHSRLGSFTNSAAKPAFGLRLPWPRLSLPPEILLIPFILSPF